MHFILLIMLLFIKIFWYKEKVVNLQNIYCKCSIDPFLTILKILTILKVMTWYLTGIMNQAKVGGKNSPSGG